MTQKPKVCRQHRFEYQFTSYVGTTPLGGRTKNVYEYVYMCEKCGEEKRLRKVTD